MPDINCKKHSEHTWCLKSNGENCKRHGNVTTTPIGIETKKLIVDLHNQIRTLVSCYVWKIIKNTQNKEVWITNLLTVRKEIWALNQYHISSLQTALGNLMKINFDVKLCV